MPKPSNKIALVALGIAIVALVVGPVSAFIVPSREGPQGVPGTKGDTGDQGPQGPQGPQGLPGEDFTIDTTLMSGQSETGLYGAWGQYDATITTHLGDAINFRIPLAVDLPFSKTQFIAGGAYTPQCTGPGNAAAGYLCVYEHFSKNRVFENIFRPTDGLSGVSKWGFVILFSAPAGIERSYSEGEWTVTAP